MDGKEEKNDTKKDEEMQKGGAPEWVQKLEQSINRLTERLETSPETEKEKPVQVPIPPTPEPDEPETLDEPETHLEKPKSRGKSFLDWLL